MAADPVDRIRTAVKNLEKWHAERDAAIRDAANADPRVSPTEIARASGLSRVHVYRIINEA